MNHVVLELFKSKFWNETFSKIPKLLSKEIGTSDFHISLICKIVFDGTEEWRTLAPMRRVNLDNKNKFIRFLS